MAASILLNCRTDTSRGKSSAASRSSLYRAIISYIHRVSALRTPPTRKLRSSCLIRSKPARLALAHSLPHRLSQSFFTSHCGQYRVIALNDFKPCPSSLNFNTFSTAVVRLLCVVHAMCSIECGRQIRRPSVMSSSWRKYSSRKLTDDCISGRSGQRRRSE